MGANQGSPKSSGPTKKPARKKSSNMSIGSNVDEVKVNEEDAFKIIELLREHEIDLNPNLSHSYILKLNLEANIEGVQNFLKKAVKLTLPPIRGIWVSPISFMNENSLQNLSDFLTYSTAPYLRVFELKTINTGIEGIETGLQAVLPKVRKQTIFNNFLLKQSDIQIIFNSSTNVKELVIFNWEIGELDDNLSFDTESSFRLQQLSLWLTSEQDDDDDDKLTVQKLDTFLGALSKTNIKETLVDICINSPNSNLKKIEDSFWTHGFNVNIRDKPIVMDL